MTTAPPLRSASLAARTFAFTPSARVPMRGRDITKREREREKGWKREDDDHSSGLEPNRRDDRRVCAILNGAHYGKLVSLL